MGMNDNKGEDILRWGTEQLFNGSSTQAGKDVTENNYNKGEEIVGTEHKKNDMLGSVKTLDWNDEATEEQGRSSLGRGKRQRKVVSYREAYAPTPEEVDMVKEKIDAKEENVNELEGKLEAMSCGITRQKLRSRWRKKEKQLAVKVEERNMICAENEELKKKVEEQGFNMRDAERMKRELQAVERDIGEAEIERNKWEEKCWDLNAVIGTKWKELEALQLECNQAIRRQKLGNGFQYELNAKGSTSIEVLGDYKSTLKPGLNSSIEEVKRTKMEHLESKVRLQQMEITSKMEEMELGMCGIVILVLSMAQDQLLMLNEDWFG
nr:hypothetical protein [Tanacetum cinerariifolium]